MNIIWRFVEHIDIWLVRGIVIGIVGVIVIQLWVV